LEQQEACEEEFEMNVIGGNHRKKEDGGNPS